MIFPFLGDSRHILGDCRHINGKLYLYHDQLLRAFENYGPTHVTFTDGGAIESSRAEFLGYQIRSLSMETDRALLDVMADSNFTMTEFYILRAHWFKGALSLIEIEAHSNLPVLEISGALETLQEKSLIKIIPNRENDAASVYEITSHGTQVRDNLMAKYSNFISSLCRGLSQKDIDHALYVLLKLHENVHTRIGHEAEVIPIR